MASTVEQYGGYRENNGNVVAFGQDYVLEEDDTFVQGKLEGDREVVPGKLDILMSSVTLWSYTERDGEIITRVGLEAVNY